MAKYALKLGSMRKFTIPAEITNTSKTLEKGGFDAYLVGGCVRDLILWKTPKDWDFTTNATPEEIQNLFSHHFYNNKFGTVTIVNENIHDESLKNIEITPYRLESQYSDTRHPDKVTFTDNILLDLNRRDFTINSIAYSISKGQFIDPHKGQDDIKDKVIKTVGEPDDRFSEDALRMLRAVRLATELGFTINTQTKEGIKKNAILLKKIAMERIRDEFTKIILSNEPMAGIELLEEVLLLQHIIPELREGIGIEQNQAHSYTVIEHNLRCVQHAANRKWTFHVRLSALLHDVAKPHTRGWREDRKDWTFYGHDVVGAKFTKKIMERLKYPKGDIDLVSKLVRYHLFFSDVDKITMSAVRRLVKNVGPEHVWELMNLRACDRIGTGRPKEAPYRLRKYESMIEEALADPVSLSMLKIDGIHIMKISGLSPGPKIGFILHALLEDVLDDPSKNISEYLEKRTKELSKMSDTELRALGEKGKEKKEEEESKKVEEIRKRHWVK